MELQDIKKGITLTIDGEIISQSGHISFKDGDKVKVKEVLKTPEKWSNFYNMYIPERIDGIKLFGKYGIWFLNTFKETKHIKQ
jgi:hypothetical protein